MLGLISLRFLGQSGHIDAFRSIVGETQAVQKLRKLTLNLNQLMQAGHLDGQYAV
jgi:hypothetical protein